MHYEPRIGARFLLACIGPLLYEDRAELFIVRRACLAMKDCNIRDEIVRLEEQLDQLAARIESCRKFTLAGRITVIGGGAVLIAMLVGAIKFDTSIMALAVAAVLGGIVAAGSNRSTAKEAARELTAADAKRTALIEQIDLRLVPDRDNLQ
jgi:hypoxanthine-guanine phosphoribosyltransferase